MADLLNTPQFLEPFTVARGDVAVTEQDSPQDTFQQVLSVVSYTKGERTALPEYGIPDQTFREGGVDDRQIVADVQAWVPDATVSMVKQVVEEGVVTAEFAVELPEES